MKIDILERVPMSISGAQPEIFQGRGGIVKLGHFNKHFIKKSRKNTQPGKILKFFLLDTLLNGWIQ